jgi:hypothetical protein
MYIYDLFVVKAALTCNANRREHTPGSPHTQTQNKTQTHTHTYAQGKKSNKHTRKTCPRETKHTYNDIIPKVWLAAQHRL